MPFSPSADDVALPTSEPLSEEMDEIDAEYLTRPASQPPGPKRIKTRERLGQIWDGFSTTLFSGSVREFTASVRGIAQLITNRIGADPTLPIVDLPAYADTLLLPAIQSIRDTEALLRDQVPSALRWIDMKKVGYAVTLVEDMDGLLKIFKPLVHGATAVRSIALSYLGQVAKPVYDDAEKETGKNILLQQDLAPLVRFGTEAAIQAQKTVKLTAKVAERTEADTLDRVKEVLSTAASDKDRTPSVPTASLPLPPLPAPQHGRKGGK